MAISFSDVVFVFSGGISNYKPELSLGGEPSSIVIGDIGNNLFDSVTNNDMIVEIIDYRCFYIFNQSEFDTLYNLKIFIENISEVVCEVGLNKFNDTQKIVLSGNPTSGSIQFGFDIYTFTINFTTNLVDLKNNFLLAFQELGYDVEVTITKPSCCYEILVAFMNADGFKYQPLMTLESNNLSPSTDIYIFKLSDGSPINTIAPIVPDVYTAPQGIVFESPTEGNPIVLAGLKPLEGVPIWLKRTIPAGPKNKLSQTFTFVMRGKSCP